MPPSVDRFLAIRSCSAAAFAKDGKTLFHLSDESGMPQIWALDLASGARRPLTAEDEKIAFFSRSPVDDRIVYGVDRGGDERQQLRLLPPGGAAVALTEAPAIIHGWGSWAPDGTAIAFTANARNEAHFDAHVMELATRTTRPIYRGEGIQTVLGWSPRGTKLLLLDERAACDTELSIIDFAMDRRRVVPRTGMARYQSARWRPDGSGFFVVTDSGREWLGVAGIDATSLEARWIHTPEHDIDMIALSPDAARLAIAGNLAGWSELALCEVASGATTIVAGLPAQTRIADLAWAPDGRSLALTLGGFARPFDIWLWHPAEGSLAPLTRSDRAGVAPGELAEARLVRFPTFDGREIPAFLFLPPGAPPQGGHKAVIWVHGGPEMQARPGMRPDLQLLLAHGYAVLVPNVRGSSGYGRSYMALDDVALRMDSVRDLRHAALWLGGRADIDDRRIAVMGQSYGGFMVLAALTEDPELWAAAVEHYGFCNFHTLLATTGPWRRSHRAREYGDPVRDSALLTRLSPIHKAERIAAPLLVTHGLRDPRVAPGESEQLVPRLRALGKTVEYLTFEDAGHGYVRPEHRRAVHRALIEFLDRHV